MYRDVKWYLALIFGIALAATFFHSCRTPPADTTYGEPSQPDVAP